MAARGTLILVVGPSGAGKDSLIAAVRSRFSDDDSLVFARRCITRPPDPDGEAHEAVSQMEFERRRDADEFMLSWQAHGLSYGIPSSYEAALRSGRAVIANASRTVVDRARNIFTPAAIVHVTASPEILAHRLVRRGRENESDQDGRLQRTVQACLKGTDVVTIVNDGDLKDAIATFMNHLTLIADQRTTADVTL